MLNIKKWIQKNNAEESVPCENRTNKIGTFVFFYEDNEQELGAISRQEGSTEFNFREAGPEGKHRSTRWVFNLTDQQHEEFVEKLSKIEGYKNCIRVNGEIEK